MFDWRASLMKLLYLLNPLLRLYPTGTSILSCGMSSSSYSTTCYDCSAQADYWFAGTSISLLSISIFETRFVSEKSAGSSTTIEFSLVPNPAFKASFVFVKFCYVLNLMTFKTGSGLLSCSSFISTDRFEISSKLI